MNAAALMLGATSTLSTLPTGESEASKDMLEGKKLPERRGREVNFDLVIPAAEGAGGMRATMGTKPRRHTADPTTINTMVALETHQHSPVLPSSLAGFLLPHSILTSGAVQLCTEAEEDVETNVTAYSTCTKEAYERGFRYFMILQTGPNSSDNDCLFIRGIELYGKLTERDPASSPTYVPPPSSDPREPYFFGGNGQLQDEGRLNRRTYSL
jgi:hypothetical protein